MYASERKVTAVEGGSYREEASIIRFGPYHAVYSIVCSRVIAKPYLYCAKEIAHTTIRVQIASIHSMECHALLKVDNQFPIQT